MLVAPTANNSIKRPVSSPSSSESDAAKFSLISIKHWCRHTLDQANSIEVALPRT